MSEIYSIRGLIDKVRESIKQTSDDNTFPDEYIYAVLLDHRNTLMYRELNKRKKISKHLYKTICMPLERSKDIPCDCIPCGLGCIVLKSKYEIPRPIRTRNYELIHVTSLDGSEEYDPEEPRIGKWRALRRTNSTKPYYTITNRYLYLVGHPTANPRSGKALPGLLISMIMEDPTQAEGIKLHKNDEECSEDSNGGTCFDPLTDTFQIDSHLHGPLLEMTLRTLGVPLAAIEDVTNNANSVPSNKSI